MKEMMISYIKRALHTMWQAGAAAAITAIGSAQTIGAVDWRTVAEVAIMAALMSFLKSTVVGVPEESNG